MFLKSLDIFGFKSFADKTRIEFADGITALLGPNGCGKSNVVDAIKWVLGEQKTGALRADKMEDVIFNGTESRKALSVAEVTLTLANETGLLPIDMPEVQIRRRLYRSGESEYSINSQEKKLKDVRELFMDTGVGKAAYSVMEQGKIDQVLSSKPEDRRYLFEEAAGITSYKAKTREAELKIARTEENIKQVEALIKEIKRNYDTLEVQAAKTIRYRALKDEIFGLERDIQLLRLKQFRDERDARGETLKNRITERDGLQKELEETSKTLDDFVDEVAALQNQLSACQLEGLSLQKDKTNKENEVGLLTEQRTQISGQIALIESRLQSITLKIEELNEDADEQDGVVRDLQKKVQSYEENITSFTEQINVAASKSTENDETIKDCEADIVNLETKRGETETKLESITDDIVAALDAGLKNAGYSAGERVKNQESLEEALKKLETLLKGREVLLRDLVDAADRAASGNPLNPNQTKQIAQTLAEAFGESAAFVRDINTLFAAYKASTPTFIDEFLAPEGIITQKRSFDAEIRSCKEQVAAKRQQIIELRGENEKISIKIDEYKATLHDLQMNRTRMIAEKAAAEDKARLIRRQIAEQEAQLKAVQDEIFAQNKRFSEINERIEDTESEIADITKRGQEILVKLDKLEKDITKRNSEVSGKQAKQIKQKESLDKARFLVEKLTLEIAQSENEINNIQENFRETHSRDLLEFEERIYQITIPQAALREDLAKQKAAEREMGQINYMAPEEFKEVKTRYDFMSKQIEDLEKAKSDMEEVAAISRQKSSDMFMSSFAKIKKNFHNMFRRLFGGGQGILRLVDAENVLESGIEIFAQPPRKKLENISLLSGGEKTMTAVALLFATYLVKPSPFCFLDEIDAALDADNVSRFVAMLREFGKKSQFIVITHNTKTSTSASTLLGVTMENGVTKTVALKIRRGNNEMGENEGLDMDAEYIDVDFVEEEAPPDDINLPPIADNIK
ncbi:MAG: AAA family ATPase [Termitinemataceae bacterium]|nr:MAG: AAA family ATPase [Termitinemataceae bacterium]